MKEVSARFKRWILVQILKYLWKRKEYLRTKDYESLLGLREMVHEYDKIIGSRYKETP